MKIEELINDLDPVTIILKITYKNIYLVYALQKISIQKSLNKEMFYEKCGCRLYKNEKTKNRIQKYVCSCCKKTFSETTGTIICYSKLSFEIWSNIIDNLLNGFRLRRIAEENVLHFNFI